jgi:iron complex outermembrane receptor protein
VIRPLAGSAALAAFAVLPALAQQVERVERIEVTGSNIKRLDAETASPVLVVTRDDLLRSGRGTVAEYLQSLTLDGQGSLPTTFGNGFAPGATAISLRGLGATATLVLVNGRRVAAYPLADDAQRQFTDLSGIPLQAVERIEVLKSGASSIYGSDAIAGVVNIILRRDVQGVEAMASTGSSRYHDGRRDSVAVLAGVGDLGRDGFNAFVDLEWMKSEGVHYRDRDRAWIGHGDLRPWGYSPVDNPNWIGGLALPGRMSTPSGTLVVPRPTGGTRIVAQLPGCSAFSSMPPVQGIGGCPFDRGATWSLQPDTETVSVFARGTWQVSPRLEAYAEAGFDRNRNAFDLGWQGVTPVIATRDGVINYGFLTPIVASHPDNPTGAVAYPRYFAADLGVRRNETSTDATRVLAGVKGAIGEWDFDAGYLHSESVLDQTLRNGIIRMSVLRAALGDPASPYFPYRLGINAGLNSPALYQALSPPTLSNTSRTKADLVDAKASRELGSLAGGPLALAIGAEARRESFDAPPMPYTETGDVNWGYYSFHGRARVWSAYAEALAPFTRAIELTLAARHDHYEAFNATTPKVGLKLMPAAGLALRASYAEGFRAPSVPEASPDSRFSAFVNGLYDPVRCPGGEGPLPGANASDCNLPVTGGYASGTPSLQPEKSKGWNGGFIWEPRNGTSVSWDGWAIRRDREIGIMPGQQALGLPGVQRDNDNLAGVPNSGTIVLVPLPYVNADYTQVVGFDVEAAHRMALASGTVRLALQWTRVNSLRRVDADGSSRQFAGTHGNCDVSNCAGTPSDRVRATAAWERGPFDATVTWQWRGPMDNVYARGEDCATYFADGTPAPTNCRLGGFNTFDLSMRWRPTRALELFGAVLNVTDRVAPLDSLTYGAISFNPLDASGATGRYFTVGARYRFR